jgi:biotin carboxyl carrier protein
MARTIRWILACIVMAGAAAGAAWAYRNWSAEPADAHGEAADAHAAPAAGDTAPVRISPQARANLGLKSKPLALSNFWRTIELPGVIVDRPGVSDRGVVSPVTGIVTKIEAFPGDSAPPGAPLFTIRLVSESIHASQLELFKATREIEISRDHLQRLSDVAQSGALPRARIIDIENQIKRLNVTVEAYQQDLEARGLPTEAIVAAARGEFVTEIVVNAPREPRRSEAVAASGDGAPFSYEVQALQVELGQQVQSGQVLADLADHRSLFIEGDAFKDDVPLVQRAAKNGWEIDVDYGAPERAATNASGDDWPPPPTPLRIHHVANLVDAETSTLAFYLALDNQWQAYEQDGVKRALWRFRPGGRVRLRVPVEEFKDVLVVPRAAVVHEGPEAFVFRQNGDYFDRRPVRVLFEDRLFAVLANDGSVRPGYYIAQNGAASLNRVLKAQASAGAPKMHVHADGTVHEAH